MLRKGQPPWELRLIAFEPSHWEFEYKGKRKRCIECYALVDAWMQYRSSKFKQGRLCLRCYGDLMDQLSNETTAGDEEIGQVEAYCEGVPLRGKPVRGIPEDLLIRAKARAQ